MSSTRAALGIFAKAPVAGAVKTRLCPPLSLEQATEFYRLSLDETLRLAKDTSCQTVIFYSGEADYFLRHYPEFPLLPQRGPDLGTRMENALRELLDRFDSAALIGSDSPDLPAQSIDEAFASLTGHDAVVAPSHDGGYVLIGERRHLPELFRDIPWSTPEVLTSTRARAAEHGIALAEISPWEDVDDEASLRRLIERSPGSRAARWARRLLF